MSDFPVVRISGGPHGKNLSLTLDGEKMERVSRLELVVDVSDVVRLKTFQYVEAEVELEVPRGPEDGGYRVRVYQVGVQQVPVEGGQPMYLPIQRELAETQGSTVREALEAAIRDLPEDAT